MENNVLRDTFFIGIQFNDKGKNASCQLRHVSFCADFFVGLSFGGMRDGACTGEGCW